jgi:hypothetical protein
MSKGWTFAAGVAGACGVGACALITHFDPAVTPDGGCATSMALVCEDFEQGPMDRKWSRQPTMGGSWSLEGSPNPVHSGQHSLHLHADASGVDQSETVVAWQLAKPAPWGFPLYLRAFVYWTDPLAPDVANFLQLQNEPRTAGFVLYAGTGQFGWTDWAAGGDSRTSAMGPPIAAWTCVEWQFNGADGKDVEVLFGGTKSSLGDPSAPTFSFYELDVGLQISHLVAEPAMDLWIDDVVLDNKPIGCGG